MYSMPVGVGAFGSGNVAGFGAGTDLGGSFGSQLPGMDADDMMASSLMQNADPLGDSVFNDLQHGGGLDGGNGSMEATSTAALAGVADGL